MGGQCFPQKTWVINGKLSARHRVHSIQVIHQSGPRSFQNNTSYCHYFWLSPRASWYESTVEDTTCFVCGTQRNQAGPGLITSSLLASFHISWRCFTGHCGRKSLQWPYSALDPTYYNTHLPRDVSTGLIMNEGYLDNQLLLDWT